MQRSEFTAQLSFVLCEFFCKSFNQNFQFSIKKKKKKNLPQKVEARIESRNIQNSKCTVDIMYAIVVSFLFLSSAHIKAKQKHVCWNPVRKIEWVSSAYLIKRNSGLKGGDNSCQKIPVYILRAQASYCQFDSLIN